MIGRFYSNDPVGFRDVHSFNRYAYANNNPYKYTDPDGRDGVLVGAGVGCALTGPGCPAGATVGAAIGGLVDLAIIGVGVAIIAYNVLKEDPIDDILEGATATDKEGEFTKELGQEQDDFDSVTEGETKTHGNGTQVGKTGDGGVVDLHKSSGKGGKGVNVAPGTPTIKIRNQKGKVKITIRYIDSENT